MTMRLQYIAEKRDGILPYSSMRMIMPFLDSSLCWAKTSTRFFNCSGILMENVEKPSSPFLFVFLIMVSFWIIFNQSFLFLTPVRPCRPAWTAGENRWMLEDECVCFIITIYIHNKLTFLFMICYYS